MEMQWKRPQPDECQRVEVAHMGMPWKRPQPLRVPAR